MELRTLLIVLLSVCLPLGGYALTACEESFCSCHYDAHPRWIIVNCNLSGSQTLVMTSDYLDENTTELNVYGGYMVLMHPYSFTRLQDIRRVRIMGTKLVTVKKHAFLNITSHSTMLIINDCESAYITSKSFSQIQGPVMVNITQCSEVTIEKEAFSWILSVDINSVPDLRLKDGAFMVETSAASYSMHGPEITIHLTEVSIEDLLSNTFGSAAAEIIFENSKINHVQKDAFSAVNYNVLRLSNTTINTIEKKSFSQKTLLSNLEIIRCQIRKVASQAMQSAITNLTIQDSKIEEIESSAITINAATVILTGNEINIINRKGLDLNSWNTLLIEKNSFGEMQRDAIVANFTTSAHQYAFTFNENDIIDPKPESLKFIGVLSTTKFRNLNYRNIYFAKNCGCELGKWLKSIFGVNSVKDFMENSHCQVDTELSRCFNVQGESMSMSKFTNQVCKPSKTIVCEPQIPRTNDDPNVIKSTRFRSKFKNEGFTLKDKRIITAMICIVTIVVLIVLMIMSIRWIRNRGYCVNIKNAIISSNTNCVSFLDRQFRINGGMDNARSISRLSVHDYSERHRLNEPRLPEPETRITSVYNDDEIIPVDNKATQTLPEELTKELLESLREKLEDPENYTEAREMIEHLYELIKVEENCNNNTNKSQMNPYELDENIYELPLPSASSTITVGRNKKQMKSIGTRVPSLDKLLPISPYNRPTALSHEYFEPKDHAVHMYAEIATNKDRKLNNSKFSPVPDVIAEQPVVRGPFLQALRERQAEFLTNKNVPKLESLELSPANTSTVRSNRSNRSINSNSSAKMKNRPLPKKPTASDPGEGTSFQIR